MSRSSSSSSGGDLASGATALSLLAVGILLSPAVHAGERAPQLDLQVLLLVPMETGLELKQLLPVAPEARLARVAGRDYIQLGLFSDARVAYRLGRIVQTRTRLPFELAYESGHPQSDGSWLAFERDARPAAARNSRQVQPPPYSITGASPAGTAIAALQTASERAASPGKPLVLPGSEFLPPSSAVQAPASATPAEAVRVAPSQPPSVPQPSLARSESAQRSTPLPPAQAGVEPPRPVNGQFGPLLSQAAPSTIPPLVRSAPVAVPLPVMRPESSSRPPPERPAQSSQSLALAVPRPARPLETRPDPAGEAPPSRRATLGRPAEPMPSKLVAALPQRLSLNAAALTAGNLTPVPRVRAHWLSSNPELNYLFVKLPSPRELPPLRRQIAVAEFGEVDGQLLARIGVFTSSRKGLQLLQARTDHLASQGYKLQLAPAVVKPPAAQRPSAHRLATTALLSPAPQPSPDRGSKIARSDAAHQPLERPLAEVISTLLTQLRSPAVPLTAESAAGKGSTASSTAIGPAPISIRRRHPLVSNPNLNYLFVKLPSIEDLTGLRRRISVTEINDVDGLLLARVGVFSSSRLGRQLLQARIDQLKAIGYSLELASGGTAPLASADRELAVFRSRSAVQAPQRDPSPGPRADALHRAPLERPIERPLSEVVSAALKSLGADAVPTAAQTPATQG